MQKKSLAGRTPRMKEAHSSGSEGRSPYNDRHPEDGSGGHSSVAAEGRTSHESAHKTQRPGARGTGDRWRHSG